MGSEVNSDKLSIKNILFTKALPNYTIPVPTNGYTIFPCTDCGDKFLFESSYNDHINRKSLKITYFCRHCNKVIINNNRCRLLNHIRSHAFKTTTINVSDIKIDPLPIEEDLNSTLPPPHTSQVQLQNGYITCFECKTTLVKSGQFFEDRAKHYTSTRYAKKVYSCPVCLFSLPNECALRAHLRIHLGVPPYFCPECGVLLSYKMISYPYNHYCEGFNMMRATTKIKCKHKKCNKVMHPNNYRMHVKIHLENIYKCIYCSKVWKIKPTDKHLPCNNNNKIINCYRCQICNNKFVSKKDINKHLTFHFKSVSEQLDNLIYPCLSCPLIFNDIFTLINHYIDKHANTETKNLLVKIVKKYNPTSQQPIQEGYYRVLKKCDKCLRSFLYRCEYENINTLPNQCPYKCTENNTNSSQSNENVIVCSLCKNKVREHWDQITTHFAKFHKNHKCLDLKVVLKKIDNETSGNIPENLKYVMSKKTNLQKKKILIRKQKIFKKKNVIPLDTTKDSIITPVEGYVCKICNFECGNKQTFEVHITAHRDPCMAYQCLDCGQCFVVKPSFSTHLLLEHGIADVEEYINKKQCYNEAALLKLPNNEKTIEEPIKENQCQICRDQFDNKIDLEKHFRVHGMAFLMKNTHKNNSP